MKKKLRDGIKYQGVFLLIIKDEIIIIPGGSILGP